MALITRNISPNWDRLMRLGNKLNYGEVRVIFQNGEPTRVEQTIKKISLEDDKDFKKDLEVVIL
jgi:hypothetical protein